LRLLGLLTVAMNIFFAFVHPHVLYGVEVYANRPTGDGHLQQLITLNNKLLRIMQSKSYNYAVKDLYLKFNILHIPQSYIHQLLKLAHAFVHHKYTIRDYTSRASISLITHDLEI